MSMGWDGRRPLRVLAVDDSAVMRGVLRTVFELHSKAGDTTLPRMELCGLMRDGVEALEGVRQLLPDVLLLDLEMPRMDGLEVLLKLRGLAPSLPVIMCSAHTERGARSTLDALSYGAKDYVMKPGQQKDFASALDSLMEHLLPKIAALAGWGQGRGQAPAEFPQALAPRPGARQVLPTEPAAPGGVSIELVVIGVSTGGPSALELMLPRLPRDFPVPVMIVQHMPRLFTGALAQRLHRLCRVPVQEARDGQPMAGGGVWLAPGDRHMEVTRMAIGRRGPSVKLHDGPSLNSCKTSADYLLRSAAAAFGPGTLALVMTGMGSDGLDGARAVRDAGGMVVAQDEASSAVWGMPGRVAKEGLAESLVPLEGLAAMLIDRVSGRMRHRERSGTVPRQPASKADEAREVQYGVL